MERVKELKAEQIKAIRCGDYRRLNEINKQIYSIREQARKEREQQREREQEERTNARILEALATI